MDRVADRGSTWRDNISPFLNKLGVVIFNPLKKPYSIGKEDTEVAVHKHYLKSNAKYDELSKIMKTIRSVDLRLVDISDFLIVNLDLDVHPCGTLEEIFWANRQKKPILIHMEQGKNNAPDWLFGTIPHQMIFDTWQDLQDYLLRVDNQKDINTFNRWYFMENNNARTEWSRS